MSSARSPPPAPSPVSPSLRRAPGIGGPGFEAAAAVAAAAAAAAAAAHASASPSPPPKKRVPAPVELLALKSELAELRSVLADLAQFLPPQLAGPVAAVAQRASSSSSTPSLDTALSRPKVGVGAVLLCPSLHPDRVVLGLRKGSHGAGKWALPGGHLEGGESFGACASREVEEECGVRVPRERFRLLHTTNDVMGADGGHYVTVFVGAVLTREEGMALRNEEPDKCDGGWIFFPWDEAATLPTFLPLHHFTREGGVEVARQLEAEAVARGDGEEGGRGR
jgi:8-oxo-dGTP diphosphatase